MDLTIRPRRLRTCESLRRMVRETRVSPDSLVYPLFLIEGEKIKEPIDSLDGQYRYSPDRVCEAIADCRAAGVSRVLLFGIPARKDACGSAAWDENGIVQQGIRAIKAAWPDCYVITDVCLCEYTDHGHCGILHGQDVDNDETLPYLARIALSQVRAGADMVAPSDMMDGRVGAIRAMLDEHGYQNTPILAYSAKYASAYYGPFRDAAESAPHFGDRRTYQMDPGNVQEALREMQADIDEGADMFIVKPAGPYQDVIRLMHDTFDVPLVTYQVSGEYSLICAAAQNGWIDRKAVIMESLIGLKRSGAKMIITYFTVEALREGWIR